MRMILLSLAATAGLFSSAAQAQDAEGQQEEMQCIHDVLSQEDRDRVKTMVMGTDAEVAVVEAEALQSLELASAACTAVFEWADNRRDAGVEYALARVVFDAMFYDLPESQSAERLDTLMNSFPQDLRDSFTFTAQDEMDDAAYDAWADDVTERLLSAGVSEDDLAPCVLYLNAYADLAVTVAIWRGLFEQGVL